MKPELMFFWAAVGLYGVSTFSYIFGIIAKQEKLFTLGLYSALLGFIPHVIAIAQRWSATGISPVHFDLRVDLAGHFHGGAHLPDRPVFYKKVRPLGVLVMPVAFVLMGWAGTLMKEVASTAGPGAAERLDLGPYRRCVDRVSRRS